MQFFKKVKKALLGLGKPGWLVFKTLQTSKIAVKMLLDGRYRWEILYKNKPKAGHHQIYTFTALDRYPQLFSECKKYFLEKQNNPAPKILSFGCSTGEEVISLGKYMPLATIIGVDINNWCINQCKKKDRNPKHFFYNRNSKEFAQAENFDAIFCMAVLQRSENRTSKDNSVSILYPYSKFESEINLLNHKLKVGGLLIIDEADFSFIDTKCADNYEPLSFKGNQIIKKRPLFDGNNRKIADTQFVYRVFRKFK